MRARLFLAMTLALSFGCQAQLPNGTKTRHTRATVAADATRVFSQGGIATEFTGRAHIISDNGLGIISNNSGGIISNNSSGIISDNGLGIISDNGLGYRVMGAAPRQECLLADAKIEVLDAQGRLLVDAAKKPITATTDKKGAYTFKAVLPKENLVLRIKLWNGGVLNALLPYDEATGKRTLEINTASTLGTAYVLEKFVKKRKEVLDRLPAEEAAGLQTDMEAARALLTGKAPTYKPADLLKTAEDLKQKDNTLSDRLDKIEAILLAGQANLGNGLDATKIALSFPLGVVEDASGQLFIIEAAAGRLRRINADGTAATVASGLGIVRYMLPAKQGGFLITCPFLNRVRHVALDGTVTDVAGNDAAEPGPVKADPLATSLLYPDAIAYAPDGTLYIGESSKNVEDHSRLFALSPSGVMTEVPTDGVRMARMNFTGLTVTKDGALWAADGFNSRLMRKKPGADWEVLSSGQFGSSEYNRLALGPAGEVLLSDSEVGRVCRVGDDGALTPIAGTGTSGYAGDGGPATSAQLAQVAQVWAGKNGTIYLADAGNALIRAIDKAGVIRTVAGTQGMVTQGDALAIAINSPTAIALDPQGRLVISETSGNTIKRLEDGKLVVIAGTAKGFSGDGGPATAAELDTPTGLAYGPKGELIFCDASNYIVRRIDAAGTISTIAGTPHDRGFLTQAQAPALEMKMNRPFSVAVDPQGNPVWSDNESNQVLKLTPDGQVHLIVGSPTRQDGDAGDGGPAADALLHLPSGIAYDKQGNLYICDTASFRIRKVSPDGTISTVVGLGLSGTLGKLIGGKPNDEGAQATGVAVVGPSCLTVAPTGEIYYAEMGTNELASLGSLSQLGALPIALPKLGARIRKIALDGTVTTVAGDGGKVLSGDGDDSLNRPIGLLIDGEGRLVICDAGNNQIKMLPKGKF